MDMNQRQLALSVLESLRADLIYARLNDGSRILDVADLRQYIYEEMGRVRASAYLMDGLYNDDKGHERDMSGSDRTNGKAHPKNPQ